MTRAAHTLCGLLALAAVLAAGWVQAEARANDVAAVSTDGGMP